MFNARWISILAFASSLATAAPCVPDTLANYELLPSGSSGGCTVGSKNLDFHDFGFVLDSDTGGSLSISPDDILVEPSPQFEDPLGLTYIFPGVVFTSDQFIQFTLSYTVDAPAPTLQVSYAYGNNNYVFNDYTSDIRQDINSVMCIGAAFNGLTCPTSTAYVNLDWAAPCTGVTGPDCSSPNGYGSPDYDGRSDNNIEFGTVSTLGNQILVTDRGYPNGIAVWNQFSQDFTSLPEPGFGPGAAALVLLLACRRSKRKSRQNHDNRK